MKINYQLKLEKIINENKNALKVPTLLLHSCCAPCSSYVLNYLSNYFKITIYFYNPNIFPQEEYNKRLLEQEKLINSLTPLYPIDLIEGPYEPDIYLKQSIGYEQDKEGGIRCQLCYKLRLNKVANLAKELDYDYFTTTLTVSPYKNSAIINLIGEELEKEYGVKYLYSDFKKNNGYKESIELSKKYDLYRQNYCGCPFSKLESITRLQKSN